MMPDGLVAALQVGHAVFNGALFLAFSYQGLMGWRIRKRRVAGVQQDFDVVKRHRRLGPALAALAPFGYLAGLTITYFSRGLLLRYPGHLAAGTLLLAMVGATFLASRRIRGPLSPWRISHAALGLSLLCAYLVQIFLGLNILL